MTLVPALLVGCTPPPAEPVPLATQPTPAAALDRDGWSPLVPLRATYDPGEIVLRAPWPDAQEVGLSLVAWGAEEAPDLVDGVAPTVVAGRTTYTHPGIAEWWVRGPGGLEQGFTVDRAPDTGPLVLELALRGAVAEVDDDARSATFRLDSGEHFRYEALAAWDGSGEPLDARMEPTDDGLRLVVESEGAVGPITVDPILPGTAWASDGGQATAYFGRALASAGDVNGDGYADVLVAAPYFDTAFAQAGQVYLYLGSAAGLSVNPAWTGSGSAANQYFGWAVASAGDVNGDGYDDVIVGVHGYTNGQLDEGAAQLYLGSAAGLGANPVWTVESNQQSAWLGAALASAGDVNGDGYDDVVVSAYAYDNGQTNEGRAYVYLGRSTGLAPSPAWTKESDDADALFGFSVASAGDVNGDGYDDVLVGAPSYTNGQTNEGSAFLYLGSSAGVAANAAWVGQDDQDYAEYAESVASAGDVNGDGYDDVIVGCSECDGDQAIEGVAFAYLGSAAGLSATPAWRVESDQGSSSFGQHVAGLGDTNGDGYDDVAVGAPDWTGPEQREGAAFVYAGSALGLLTLPQASYDGDQRQAWFGLVKGAGDVNGDGATELLVGAYQYDNGLTDEGAAFLYAGRVLPDGDGDGVFDPQDLCPSTPDPEQLDVDGDAVGNACDDPYLALSGTVVSGARATFVVTGAAPGETVRFDAAVGNGGNGPCPAVLGGLCLDLGNATSMGTAVVDATGTATRVLNVPAVVQPNGVYSVQASVARGAGGADSVKSARLRIDGDVIDWDGDGLVDAVESGIGTDPADADTDGDGFSDLAEMAPHYDPLLADADGDGIDDPLDACLAGDDGADVDGDGVADACDDCPNDANASQADADADHLGDACDLPALRVGTNLEENQANAYFGYAVATADVNGDGYDDVIVGAKSHDAGQQNEGRVTAYLGSAAGVSTVAAWSAEGDQAGADFGYAVASAGDVNGDGYDDVLIGAPYFDNGQSNEGRVYLYLGSAAGLQAAPAWTKEINQVSAELGSSLASAGDVNGDGYDDVALGSELFDNDGVENRGKVLVFHGSAAGLPANPSWSRPGEQYWENFGRSIGSADVNGDGFDDLVVGSPNFTVDLDHADVGAVSVFFGSAAGLAAEPSWRVFGDLPSRFLGQAVAGAGDVNGDGYDDVIAGPYHYHDGMIGDLGAAYGWYGSPIGPSTSPDWTVIGDQDDSYFGWYLSPLGDVNGDGFDDVIVGAQGYTLGQSNEGAAFVYLGSADGLAPQKAWLGQSDQAEGGYDAYCGCYEDQVYYGTALSSGDVNGDGYGDAVIGAHAYNGGQSDEGRVYVRLGQLP